MTDQPYRTKTGRTLTDDEIDQLADDLAAREFGIEDLRQVGTTTARLDAHRGDDGAPSAPETL